MPAEHGPAERGPAERARLAAEALAQAKADAQARGESPPRRRRSAPGGWNAGGPPATTGTPPASTGGVPPGAAAAPPGDPGPPGSAADAGGAARPGGVRAGSATPPGAAAGPDGPARPGGATVPRAGRAGSAARPRRARRDDPQPLGAAIGGLLDDRGWRQDLAVGGVFGRWDQIVGAELAAHTRPEGFADGELLVTADSTAWATQVRLLAATLVARVNAELGNGVVRRVKVRGPAPPPRSGPWRVRGGRGPRDDYG